MNMFARSLLLILLTAFASHAAGPQDGTTKSITLNAEGIPPWEFSTDPGENWRFFAPAWQTVPLSSADLTDFELSATLTIGAYEFKTPPYDTEHYSRFMELPQFHYQGGLVLRRGAKGEVWVDDVSFQPLKAGRQP